MSAFEAERIVRDDDARIFKVNGTEFRVKPMMAAMDLAEWEDAYFAEESAVKSVQMLQDFIGKALEPGQEEAWAQAVARDNPQPMSLYQLEQIALQHIRAVVAGRPFVRPQDSGGSSGTTGTTSTVPSPSPEAT